MKATEYCLLVWVSIFSFIDNSEIIEKDAWSGFYTSDGSSFYLGDHDRNMYLLYCIIFRKIKILYI